MSVKFKERLYKNDVAILKDYNGMGYKLSLHKTLRTSGLDTGNFNYSPKGSINDEKLDVSLSRTKSKLYEYAMCNPWEMFLTITLDPSKYDRFDLSKFNKDLNMFIKNYNKKYSLKIKRIFVPEEHKKGGWHMHGLIMGLPLEHLRLFTLKEKLPDYIREKLLKGEKVYDWVAYREKFGFNDFEFIREKENCYKYIIKYITKETGKGVKDLNAHLYYASQGLEVATVKEKGSVNCEFTNPDFQNDWVKVKWIGNDVPYEYIVSLFD